MARARRCRATDGSDRSRRRCRNRAPRRVCRSGGDRLARTAPRTLSRRVSTWRTSYEEFVTGLTITAVNSLPEIRPGDDLATLIREAALAQREAIRDGDIVVIAQKIVSKSEGRIVRLADVVPGQRAQEMAAASGKDARQIEVVLSECAKIVRWERGILICETRHGFVCANAGVDRSNAGAPDTVVLLPVDPDASATRLRDAFGRAGATVSVVVTDTFGRAWREGHTNVAIGLAGLPALKRYVGQRDPEGYELRVTEIAVADQTAAAPGSWREKSGAGPEGLRAASAAPRPPRPRTS